LHCVVDNRQQLLAHLFQTDRRFALLSAGGAVAEILTESEYQMVNRAKWRGSLRIPLSPKQWISANVEQAVPLDLHILLKRTHSL